MANHAAMPAPAALLPAERNHFGQPLSAAEEIRQLKLLAQASTRIHSTLDAEQVLRHLVEAALELIDADKGGAGLVNGDNIEFNVGKINGKWQEVALWFSKGVGIAGHTWKTHQPYISNKPLSDPQVNSKLCERLGCYNAAAVPVLSADGRYLGCFEVHNKKHGSGFTQRDIALIEHLAVYAAVALDNARLFREQKAASELVRRSAERYQQMFHNNMAIKLLVEPASGRIVDANQAALRFYGFSALVGMTLNELETEPSALSNCSTLPPAVLSGDEPVQTRHRCANGDIKTAQIGISPVTIADHELFFAVVHDVTTRLEAETALADSEQMTQIILENICEGVCRSGKDGLMQFVNPAAEKLMGHKPEDVIGRNALEFIYVDPREKHCPGRRARQQIIGAYNTGQSIRCDDACFINADGEPVPVEFLCAPTRNSAGEITGIVMSFMDIRERLNTERDIRKLAYTDSLTGLPNRLALQQRLNQLLTKARKTQRSGAMLFCDVDNFKTINDSLGHSVGDEMLKEMSARARSSAAPNDVVARHGGDEFVLVSGHLSSTTQKALQRAQQLANKLQAQLAKPYNIDGQILHGSVSIGIALFGGEPELGAGDIMRHADTAMYEAKRQGRGATCQFMPAMQQAANHRLQLERELRLALQRGELVAQYQPKVGVDSNTLYGAEALMRWHHPEHGTVMPDDFISAAEESGLMLELGEAIFSQVFSQLAEWRAAGLQAVPIAINLSASQFNQPRFAQYLSDKLNEYDVPGNLLELEITETTLMQNPEQVRMNMLALRQLGVRISVDDFGTGYSSLNYLKKFPLDTIKIDRAFISDISIDPDDRAITSAIVSMAKALALKTVAEGVETETQLNYLRSLGCDQFQGWLHSRAMPARAFTRLLQPKLTLVT